MTSHDITFYAELAVAILEKVQFLNNSQIRLFFTIIAAKTSNTLATLDKFRLVSAKTWFRLLFILYLYIYT